MVCAHPVALTGGSVGEEKLQVVTELGMLGKTDDDEGGGGGDDGDGGGGAVANSSQTEELDRWVETEGQHKVRVAGKQCWCQQNILLTGEVALSIETEYGGDGERVSLGLTQAPG